MTSQIENHIFNITGDMFEEYLKTFWDSDNDEPTKARCWSKMPPCIKGHYWSVPPLIPSHNHIPYRIVGYVGTTPTDCSNGKTSELFSATRQGERLLCVISDRGKPGSHRCASINIIKYCDEFVQDVLFKRDSEMAELMPAKRAKKWDITSSAVSVHHSLADTILVFPEKLVYQYTNPWLFQ